MKLIHWAFLLTVKRDTHQFHSFTTHPTFIHNTPTRKRSHQVQDIHTSHTSHSLRSNARERATRTALTDTDIRVTIPRVNPGSPGLKL